MSYKLEYPYTDEERMNFIVEYNHNRDLRIETVDNYFGDTNFATYYALEANELLVNGEVIIDPGYEAKQEQARKERIAKLYLTAADVERGIYQAKGMDFEDILSMVKTLEPQGLDIKALKIELKANHFYRGNPYVSAIGTLLGFSEEQLNLFFKDGDYKHLLSKEESIETSIEEPIAYDDI